jgi:hypothetical protein
VPSSRRSPRVRYGPSAWRRPPHSAKPATDGPRPGGIRRKVWPGLENGAFEATATDAPSSRWRRHGARHAPARAQQEAYDAAVAAAIAEAEAAAKAEAEKAKKGCDWNPFGGNSCLAAAVDVVTHIDPATIAHAVLGVVAMVPITPINSIAAVVDAGLYVAEGDYAAAAMSMLGVIPGGAILAKVGTAAVAVKGASTVIRGASNIVKTGASAARTAASATATAAKVKLLNTMGRGIEKLESAVSLGKAGTSTVDQGRRLAGLAKDAHSALPGYLRVSTVAAGERGGKVIYSVYERSAKGTRMAIDHLRSLGLDVLDAPVVRGPAGHAEQQLRGANVPLPYGISRKGGMCEACQSVFSKVTDLVWPFGK